ncbi:MAG: DNA translocase FtsK 4TM domain-containing protein [Chloroflexota bacterium]
MAKKTTTRTTSTKRKTEAKSGSTRGGTGKRTPRKKPPSRKTSTSRKPISFSVAQKALMVGILIIFITVILVLSLLSPTQGQLTTALAGLMRRTFGWGSVLLPVITGGLGLYLVLWGMEQPPELPAYRLAGAGLLYFAFLGFASLTLLMLENEFFDPWVIAQAEKGGGYLGGLVASVLMTAVGNLGAIFTLTVVAILGTILVSGVTRQDMGNFLQALFRKRPSLPTPTRSTPRTPRTPRDLPINTNRPQRAPVTEAAQPRLIPDPPAAAAETAVPTPNPAKPEPKPTAQPARRGRSKPAPEPADTPTIVTPVFLGGNGRSPQHNWKLPVLEEILESGTDMDPSGTIIREQVEIIEHTLESFGAPATVVEINQGPTITQFGVEPSFLTMRNGKRTKVKVGKIASLADDLTLALHAQSIRVQAPVPGKGYVGIEVPNPAKALVSLRDVMETTAFGKLKSPLRIGLGQDVAGQPIVADLAGMPHLLIAGATGSGKSVCVNAIIASLLLLNTPDQLKLVMVDPKRVELTGYNGIPHLAAPVVVEMDKVIGVLQWAMREMDNRYKMFAEVGARNIVDYNKKTKRNKSIEELPYIVIIVDELADLMMLSPEETERGITRLAQLARATGMHMVIATQRPSVDVVTGLIKANFPARVAFAVASSTDSRVILDSTGAERLLGQGDMLYQSPDAAAPVRSQGCYVSDGELNKLIGYWQAARRFNVISAAEAAQPKPVEIPSQPVATPPPQPKPEAKAAPPAPAKTVEAPVVNMGKSAAKPVEEDAPTVVNRKPVASPTPQPEPARPTPTPPPAKPEPKQQPLWEALQEMENEEPKVEIDDDLMPEAIEMVRKLNKASTSLLQRRFRIGYTRAARLIDAMEEMGIIGPPTGTSKAREVLGAAGSTSAADEDEDTIITLDAETDDE